MTQRILLCTIFLAAFLSCRETPTAGTIDEQFRQGRYSQAEQGIVRLLTGSELTEEDSLALRQKLEIIERTRQEFCLTEDQVRERLKAYYPELNDSMLRRWEEDKVLEMRLIDGRRRYFKYAHHNLFRLDEEAKQRKIEMDGAGENIRASFCRRYADSLVREAGRTGRIIADPWRFRIRYNIILMADAVPPGTEVRCWMPFPREHPERQPEVRLLRVDEADYTLAPPGWPQRTLYLEKTAVRGRPTVFEEEFEMTTAALWLDIDPEKAGAYDTTSATYREHTCERPPHIVFSEPVRELSGRIVAGETNPVTKVRKIFRWINDSIPWASALEYSIMECIPAYVLEQGHGDCGMQSLLFITLARYNGVPARWQSGWYLFPVQTNLHDWAEVYYEGYGWVPVDPSFGLTGAGDDDANWFYTQGMDPFRLIINNDYGRELYPPKVHFRSEPVDFQRGELEWEGGNLYYDTWDYSLEILSYGRKENH